MDFPKYTKGVNWHPQGVNWHLSVPAAIKGVCNRITNLGSLFWTAHYWGYTGCPKGVKIHLSAPYRYRGDFQAFHIQLEIPLIAAGCKRVSNDTRHSKLQNLPNLSNFHHFHENIIFLSCFGRFCSSLWRVSYDTLLHPAAIKGISNWIWNSWKPP